MAESFMVMQQKLRIMVIKMMKNDSMRFLDVSNNYEKVCDHGHYTGKYSTSNL